MRRNATRYIISAFTAFVLSGLGFSATSWQKCADDVQKTIVLLSDSEWMDVKRTMDRRGVCEIAKDGVVLLVTNGVHGAVHLPPSLLDDDRNLRRRKGDANGGSRGEPGSYPHQSTL